MAEQRLIDVNVEIIRAFEDIPEPYSEVLIDFLRGCKTIDPESLPIVQQLRTEIAELKNRLEHDENCGNYSSQQNMYECNSDAHSNAATITNADRIRAMNDFELANFLDDVQRKECESLHLLGSNGDLKFKSCVNGWLYWLTEVI